MVQLLQLSHILATASIVPYSCTSTISKCGLQKFAIEESYPHKNAETLFSTMRCLGYHTLLFPSEIYYAMHLHFPQNLQSLVKYGIYNFWNP